MRKFFLILMFFLCIERCFSSEENYFQEGLNTGKNQSSQANEALKHFDPNNTFKQFTENPPESDYYHGGTETKTTLGDDAAKALPNNETAVTVQESMTNRPEFKIDPDSPEMEKSQLIQNNAVDIVNGVSNEFVDCNKQQTCTTIYETKVCEESPVSVNQYCKKNLSIDMIPHQTDTHYPLSVHLSAKKHDYAGVDVNAVTGKVIFKGPSEASFAFSGRLPAGIDCNSLHGTYVITNTQHHTYVDMIALPNCSNGLTFSLHITGDDGKAVIDLQIDMISSNIVLEPKDRWDDQCVALANNSLCTFQDERCIEENTTHTIQGISVTRACWEYESHYLCRSNNADNTCQPLRDQGCEQIDSVCKNKNDGGCTLYSQTFRCPIKTCDDTAVICNGETFCLTEDCLEHSKTADPDFQKAVSELSAVNAASKSFDQNTIFTGVGKSCHSDIVGFTNCCADDGWGIDMHLAECTDEEKELGKAKENKQTVYVGSYCETDVMGVCLSHRKSYCVFSSLLDQIIQQQGRGQQLKIGFGKPEHPNCRGITPEELQHINFDLIDFSDFYADIAKKQNIEDSTLVNERIKEDIQNSVDGAK